VAIVLAGASLRQDDESAGRAVVGTGWLVGLGSVGVGIGLVLVSDKTNLEQVPPRTPGKGEREEDARLRGTGVGLRGTF
jgi:hypothetical protein